MRFLRVFGMFLSIPLIVGAILGIAYLPYWVFSHFGETGQAIGAFIGVALVLSLFVTALLEAPDRF